MKQTRTGISAFLIVFLSMVSINFVLAEGQMQPAAPETVGLKVVASTSIVYDVVRTIAGKDADVYGLIKPGIDPHGFEPAPRDIARAESADLIFVNGFGLEENLLSTLEKVKPNAVVEVSSLIDPIEGGGEVHGEHAADHHHAIDPHTWMSPMNVISWVDVIEGALSKADPAHRASYSERASAYRQALIGLHTKIEEEVAKIPVGQRVLLTDHNTLGYFARDYGFKVVGSILSGFSSNTEPSAKDLASLAGIIREHDVQVVFIGETAGDRVLKLSKTLSETVSRPIDVRMLLTGSLTEKGGPGDTYLSFMKYDAGQIVDGLSGGAGR